MVVGTKQSMISQAAVEDDEDEDEDDEDEDDEGEADDEADGARAMRRSPDADAEAAFSALPLLPLSSHRSVPRRTCSMESEREMRQLVKRKERKSRDRGEFKTAETLLCTLLNTNCLELKMRLPPKPGLP